MLSGVKAKARSAAPPREIIVQLSAVLAVLSVMSFTGLADQAELQNTLQSIGNFISLIIVGVAVPNGAYGFLQYMTAGSNVDQDEKGRTRIRNTFIALGGVAVIQIAVNVFEAMIIPDDATGGFIPASAETVVTVVTAVA